MRRLGEKLVAGAFFGGALACEPGGEGDIFDELCLEAVGNVSACEMLGDDWTAAQLEDCEVQRESLEDEATVECREAVLDLDVCIAVAPCEDLDGIVDGPCAAQSETEAEACGDTAPSRAFLP